MASAAPARRSAAVSPDSLVLVKVSYDDANRRVKLPLKDLGAYTLPSKLRQILDIPSDANMVLERYSDSAAAFVVLDSENPSVYKQLYRAAKAKLKLRLKASVIDEQPPLPPPSPPVAPPPLPAHLLPLCPAEASPPPPLNDNIPAKETNVEGPKAPVSTRASYLDTVLQHPVPLQDVEPTTNNENKEEERVFGIPTGSAADEPNNDFRKVNSRPCKLTWDAPLDSNQFMNRIWSEDTKHVTSFCIDCNNCGTTIADDHFHCSICDEGDYDLCPACVDAGVLCLGDSHWLIKRTLKDGTVVNSTTETIAPKQSTAPEPEAEPEPEPEPESEPEPKLHETAEEYNTSDMPTCNACFNPYHDKELVTCLDCPDYDLCAPCLIENVHGHHPGHRFSMIDPEGMAAGLSLVVGKHCRPGRVQPHEAICDGCQKAIVGVRNKCFSCPDWDYCSDCMENAAEKHPGHRFAPLYAPIGGTDRRAQKHVGVFCDGPFCRDFTLPAYISGIRYKCTICHDTDFCANCEAHPSNTHNPTHPLIKIKTPVRNVSVRTYGEDDRGALANPMGDRRATTKSTATETVGPRSSNAATQVQNRDSSATLSPEPEVKPEPKPQPFEDGTKSPKQVQVAQPAKLQAYFVKDTLIDGSDAAPDSIVTQTWTLYNPGPLSWPQGSSIRFVGGDSMFNVDTAHPTSLGSLTSAMESNALSQPVDPSTCAEFTVTLRTPRRMGRAISYWRLKTPDGEPFGHRLWCDVQVREAHTEQVVQEESVTEEGEEDSAPTTEGREADLEEESAASSGMIFPKLEKESPDASTHELVPPAQKVEQRDDEHELAEEVESLAIDEETEDGGFLTDEEYDILDASDQEYAVEAQKSAQKSAQK